MDSHKSNQSRKEYATIVNNTTVRVGKKSNKKSQQQFQGVANFVRKGHNITKVSNMLYRVIRKYKVHSMVDVPCRSHSRWMGQLLASIKREGRGNFAYFCVDSSRSMLDLVASRMPETKAVDVIYIDRKFWKEHLPRADLVFAWDGLEMMKVENVHSFVSEIIQGGRHEYFLVGSSPSVMRNGINHGMNVRKMPYMLGQPMRMFKELNTDKSVVEKQMYLYKLS